MKTYRTHYCDKQHRNYQTLAKCLWPRASFRTGDGEFALVAKCRRGVTTVTLHSTSDSALQTRIDLDAAGCGGACRRNHEVIRLAVA